MVCNKIYLDTNIILDFLDPTRPHSKISITIWRLIAMYEIEIVISEDMLSTIFYIHKNKQQVLELFQNIQNIWTISSFGTKVISDAIQISLEKNLDLEDVLQCLCVKENSCDIFLSNNGGFYEYGVEIMTSKQFLQEIDKSE